METTKVAAEQPTKVKTGMVRFSYANVFEPKAFSDGEGDSEKGTKKYYIVPLIPKTDKITIKAINKAIAAAIELGKSTKYKGKPTTGPKFHMPLRDGDEEKPDHEEYAGHYFLTAKSDKKPTVLDKNRDEIIDQEDFYSGCYGRLTLNFFPYEYKGNIGVGCGLQNIQKLKEGEPFSGRSSAQDDFADDFELDEDDDDIM